MTSRIECVGWAEFHRELAYAYENWRKSVNELWPDERDSVRLRQLNEAIDRQWATVNYWQDLARGPWWKRFFR